MLTADTITDGQIAELRHAYTMPSGEVNSDVEHACDLAASTLPSVRGPARAVCAAMLNILHARQDDDDVDECPGPGQVHDTDGTRYCAACSWKERE